MTLIAGSGDTQELPPFLAFVGPGSGEVMDAPGPKCDRRLELPFSFEVAG